MQQFRNITITQPFGIIDCALLLRVSGAALLLSLVACGGSNPPPASAGTVPVASAPSQLPATPSASAATSASTAAPSASATAEPPKPPSAAPADAKPVTSAAAEIDASGMPEQSPIATVTAAGAAFLVDYRNSEAKVRAQASCAKAPKKDDPASKATCMDKARAQFLADVLVFKSDKKGNASLTIYKRTDSALAEVFKAPVSLKDESPKALKVTFKGGGSGARPLFKNSNSATIQMPNSYTLEVTDAQYGTLHYEAKIGLVNE